MTVEYVLLLVTVTMALMKVVAFGPRRAFHEAGPKLGARVEYQLATGNGFKPSGKPMTSWSEPK